MKKEVLQLLLAQWNQLDRKMKKILLVTSGIFFVLFISITVLLGYFAFKTGTFLFHQVTQLDAPQMIKVTESAQLEKAQGLVTQLSSPSCLNQLGHLASIDIWLSQPIADHWRGFKKACFGDLHRQFE